jgi:hypothetical protein
MKKVGFLIQGKTFLKSIFPLVVFANRSIPSIDCTLYLYSKRSGKPYDNLDMEYVSLLFDRLGISGTRVVVVGNDNDVLVDSRENGVGNIICQDAQHHGRAFCVNKDMVVFSIGVFFDSLHFANTTRLSKSKPQPMPNVMYFPNSKFSSEFERIMPNEHIGKCSLRPLGSPLYDHSLFVDVADRPNKSVCFLSTLQNLVSKETQRELEEFIRFCNKTNVDFIMKVKNKTPWMFMDGTLNDKVILVDSELGFPYTSLDLILNTDLHISSYSTSACEAQYFCKPCINLESVSKDNLIYAIRSIKCDYKFNDLFNSDICKTVSKNIVGSFIDLIGDQINEKHDVALLTMEDNNSIRILNDIAIEAQ